MTLIVEDGTGLVNADSFASVAEADAGHADFNNTGWFDKSLAQKEADLREATKSLTYDYQWKGVIKSQTQALAWPRVGVVDHEGRTIPSDVVPKQVKDACIYLAQAKGTAPIHPVPSTSTSAGQIKRKKVGDLEQEFFEGTSSTTATRTFTAVKNLLAGLTTSMPGGINGQLERWS